MKLTNNKFAVLFANCTLVLAAVMAVVPVQVRAQAVSGDLVGQVLDKSGAGVPNAAVEVTHVATGVKATTKANDVGEYRFNNLQVGTYRVSASAPNFATTTINEFRVELNKVSTLQITLQVSGTVTTVEVSGASQALDTTTATLSNTFESRLTADLPTASIGSGVLNLSLLNSGVASSGGVGAGAGPTVGGQRPRNNNFTIEGVDNNSKSVTGPLVSVPGDAVAEFSVLQNQYSPEFGHSSGGQFNIVVKGGSNAFHGLAYIYSQNRNFNALDQIIANQGFTGPLRYDLNRFGGSIGGPVIKNKLFFYGNYEWTPLGRGSTTGAVCTPTAAGFTTLAGLAGLNATNLAIFTQFTPVAPTSTCNKVVGATIPVNGTNVPIGDLPINAPNFTNYRYLVASMDYSISSKDQLRGRYIYNSAVGIDNSPNLPVFFLPFPTKFHLVTINEYHTFTPNVTNEFRLGYNRFTQVVDTGNFKFPGLDSFPDLIFEDLGPGGLQLGPDPNGPQFTIQNLYQATEALSWTIKKHTLKFGVEGRKIISPQSFTQRSRGDYDYCSLDFYLRDQIPDCLAERSLGNPVYYGDQISLYWYVNDNWRIRPNLTINLGLRHEYTTIPVGERVQSLNQAASVPGLIDFSEPRAPKKNFAPRVGFAYSPGTNGRTSIRGGFGISYDVLYDNIGILSLPPQLSGTIDCPGPVSCPANGVFLASGGILPVAGGLQTFPNLATQRAFTANHIVVNQKDPSSIQWSLGVQHTFWNDYTAELRYVGTRGVHLNVQERINRQARTTKTLSLPTFFSTPTQATLDALPVTLAQINAAIPSFVPAYSAAGFGGSNVVQFSPDGSSTYHGMAAQITRRFTRGLTFIGAYTWSRLIDNSTADFFTTLLTPRRPQDFVNLRNDFSTSALDRRHRFTMAVLYDVPYFKNRNWLIRNTLGNWEFAPIYTFQSPEFATVQSATDSNGNGDGFGDRAVFNPAGTPGVGSDVFALFNTAGATVAYEAVNHNAQYVTAGARATINIPRNTLPTRRINNFDMTAVKRFSITERYRVEFQCQFLNILNHPQFVPGSLNDIAQITTSAGGVRNYLTPSNPAFNDPEVIFSSNPRSLQLSLKFLF